MCLPRYISNKQAWPSQYSFLFFISTPTTSTFANNRCLIFVCLLNLYHRYIIASLLLWSSVSSPNFVYVAIFHFYTQPSVKHRLQHCSVTIFIGNFMLHKTHKNKSAHSNHLLLYVGFSLGELLSQIKYFQVIRESG